MMVGRRTLRRPKFTGPRVRKFTDFKENNTFLARRLSLKDKENRNLKKMELENAFVRNKVKLKMQHYETTLGKIYDNFACWKSFLVKFLDMLEESTLVIQAEREENMQLLQQLDGDFFHGNETLKTQPVSPMVSGLPLKRASITLKRLNPFNLQQRARALPVLNNEQRRHLSPPPVLEQEDNITPPTPVVSTSIENTSQDVMATPASRVVGPSVRRSAISRHSRCGVCHDASSSRMPISHDSPSPSIQQVSDVHLKRASIQLTRLDPRLYLCGAVTDNSDVTSTNSERQETCGKSAENHEEVVHQQPSVSFNFTKVPNRPNCVPTTSTGHSPMVVLERMERYEYFAGESTSQNAETLSSPDSTPVIFDSCRRYKPEVECPTPKNMEFDGFLNRREPKVSLVDVMKKNNGDLYTKKSPIIESSEKNVEKPTQNTQPSPDGPPVIFSFCDSSKSEEECPAPKNMVANNNRFPFVSLVDVMKQAHGESAECLKVPDTEIRKSPAIESPLKNIEKAQQEVAVDEFLEPREDIDPLEGPSWLYSGVKTPAQINKFKEKKKDFTAVYRKLLVQYESSDDENVNESPPKKKLRRDRKSTGKGKGKGKGKGNGKVKRKRNRAELL